MKTSSLKFTIIVCVTLVVMQTVFMFIPVVALSLYNIALRPLVYGILMAAVMVFMGLDSRPVRKAYGANMVAVLSVTMFGVVFLITVFLFGAGTNVVTINANAVARNLWEHGSIVILGELIRR